MASNNKKPPTQKPAKGKQGSSAPKTRKPSAQTKKHLAAEEARKKRIKELVGTETETVPEKKQRAKELLHIPAEVIPAIPQPVTPQKLAKPKKVKAPKPEPEEDIEEEYYEEERGFRIPWLRWFFNLIIAGVLLGGCVGVVILLYYTKDLPSIDKLYAGPSSPPITLLARDGTTLGVLGGFHGEARSYKEFPPTLIHAVLATEDRRFFSHMGMDVQGLTRAMLKNLRAGRIVEGGSTITQQLAKVVFLTSERSIKRKVQEMILAVWLEYTFTKEEILAMYLNRVYMGAGNYGVDAAAQQYFGKSIGDITVYESAMIAGLLKAPSRYSPFNNPKLSQERTRQVLLNMVDAGYIDKKQVAGQPERLEDPKAAMMHKKARFFVDWVGSLIPEYITVPDEGITVVTTLDPLLQTYAEQAVRDHADKFEGALVSVTPQGEVLAMVGGRSYDTSQFNRAAQAKRQPGSSFKFFVYLAAMEKGYGPLNTIIDEPVAIKDFSGWWSPQNYHNDYLGEVTLEKAFAKSINTVAVKLSEDVGRPQVIEIARRLGVTSPMLNTPSLALGTNEVSLLEMVQAYAHMPNDGRMVRLHTVQKILSNDGQVIYTHPNYDLPRILDHNTVLKMNTLLASVPSYGTAQSAKIGRPVGGKTGTTQEHRDAWFIGYTPQVVTGVWVGKDDNTSLGRVTGGTVPAKIFHDYMVRAHETLPVMALPDIGQIVPEHVKPEAEGGFMRWFGFGSRKNRREPTTNDLNQQQRSNPFIGQGETGEAPQNRWQIPDGEELTPSWRQPLNQQPVQEPAAPGAGVIFPDMPDGHIQEQLPPPRRAPVRESEGLFDRLFGR